MRKGVIVLLLLAIFFVVTAIVALRFSEEEPTTVESSQLSGKIVGIKTMDLTGVCKVRVHIDAEVDERTIEVKKLRDFCTTAKRGDVVTVTKIVRTRVTDGEVLEPEYQ